MEESWERIKSNYPEHELKVLNVQAKSLNSIITSICYDYNAYKHIVIAPQMDSLSFLEVEGPRVYQPEPGYDERCSVCV